MSKTTGIIKSLFPPGSDAVQPGAGQIERTVNGVTQGPPYYVFHTPDDNASIPMLEGAAVLFDAPANGNKASGVILDEINQPRP